MTQILKFVLVISKSVSERYCLYIGSVRTLHVTLIKLHVAGYPEYRDELIGKERGGGGDIVQVVSRFYVVGGTE